MTSEFDVNQYWLSRGRTYMEEQRTPPEFHRRQEQFLLDVLQRGRIPMRRVLELGCGFGRITKRIAARWPNADVMALDVSPEQLANARRHCGENPRLHFAPYDFYSAAPLPGSDYDTVVAIEVFLHHPPEVVTALLRKAAAIGRYVVNLDWSEDWAWSTPEHVWVHDYAKLFATVGLPAVTFVLPERIDGKQQKLFIAAPDMPPELVALERELRDVGPPGPRHATPSPDEWCRKWSQALTELAGVIPRGSNFILVDDAQCGGPPELNGSRVIPFLEKNGVYWGPPDSDATAWRELERLCRAGATHLAFAWPSFWWLEHYGAFHQILRARFRCLLENERLLVFALDK